MPALAVCEAELCPDGLVGAIRRWPTLSGCGVSFTPRPAGGREQRRRAAPGGRHGLQGAWRGSSGGEQQGWGRVGQEPNAASAAANAAWQPAATSALVGIVAACSGAAPPWPARTPHALHAFPRPLCRCGATPCWPRRRVSRRAALLRAPQAWAAAHPPLEASRERAAQLALAPLVAAPAAAGAPAGREPEGRRARASAGAAGAHR